MTCGSAKLEAAEVEGENVGEAEKHYCLWVMGL